MAYKNNMNGEKEKLKEEIRAIYNAILDNEDNSLDLLLVKRKLSKDEKELIKSILKHKTRYLTEQDKLKMLVDKKVYNDEFEIEND